jgi:hypothetical protein
MNVRVSRYGLTRLLTDYRIGITVAEHGYDLENGERFLDGFEEAHPEVGPSVSQNTADGTLRVTFSFDAEDAKDALAKAIDIFSEGAIASGLPATEILAYEISLTHPMGD